MTSCDIGILHERRCILMRHVTPTGISLAIFSAVSSGVVDASSGQSQPLCEPTGELWRTWGSLSDMGGVQPWSAHWSRPKALRGLSKGVSIMGARFEDVAGTRWCATDNTALRHRCMRSWDGVRNASSANDFGAEFMRRVRQAQVVLKTTTPTGNERQQLTTVADVLSIYESFMEQGGLFHALVFGESHPSHAEIICACGQDHRAEYTSSSRMCPM